MRITKINNWALSFFPIYRNYRDANWNRNRKSNSRLKSHARASFDGTAACTTIVSRDPSFRLLLRETLPRGVRDARHAGRPFRDSPSPSLPNTGAVCEYACPCVRKMFVLPARSVFLHAIRDKRRIRVNEKLLFRDKKKHKNTYKSTNHQTKLYYHMPL